MSWEVLSILFPLEYRLLRNSELFRSADARILAEKALSERRSHFTVGPNKNHVLCSSSAAAILKLGPRQNFLISFGFLLVEIKRRSKGLLRKPLTLTKSKR